MSCSLSVLSELLDQLITDGYDTDRLLIFLNTYLKDRRSELI